MLKNNKAMMKMNYKMQFGMDLTDEQCDSMLGMMTPDVMKMAKNMYSQDPEGFKNRAAEAHNQMRQGNMPPVGGMAAAQAAPA